MKKIFFCFVIFTFFVSSFNDVTAEKYNDPAKVSKPKSKQMLMRLKAYFRYREGNYYGALRVYRFVYEFNKTDAKINFLIGKCNVQLQNMEEAIPYLLKTKKLKPDFDKEVDFLLGEAYQYTGDLDSAIYEFNIYKLSLKPRQLKKDAVVDLLNQTVTAKMLIEHPVNVKIKNLGFNINSEFDDAMPSITADGKTLIFTSRRADTKGGGIDPNTGQYYDDIYMATWNDEKGTWNTAESVEGDLNTAGHDACLSISPDGNTIFVYRNIPKVTGSGDIYYSTKRADGKWNTPKTIGKPVNSSYFESSACLSPDGNTLYFVSERKGGYGNGDIWKSKKIGKNLWGDPVNLGPVINTEEDELGVFMHPDGKTLFFTSKGHNTMGGYDIFMSQMKSDSSWTEPVNLGYPINSTKDEISFVMSADSKTAYISSRKDGGLGGADIYEIDMSNYTFLLKIEGQEVTTPKVQTGLSILKGSIIESNAAQQVEAEIFIKDAATGKEVTKLFTNETGDFFVTLKGDKEYEISIEKPGYKKYSEKVLLPFDQSKINTLVKLIILEKLPEEKK
jgi:Tol biopolymer transport system component